VTAEAAAVLPVLVAVVLGLTWLVGLAGAQVRVVDAARETARAAARGESDGVAVDHGRRVAPEARITVSRGAESVRVEARAEFAGPGGLFAFLPGVELDAQAVAAREPE
jgi:Flp pilus assembly protein TadG